jgi:hypothetical protein
MEARGRCLGKPLQLPGAERSHRKDLSSSLEVEDVAEEERRDKKRWLRVRSESLI